MNYCLYRILGNDLPPRHSADQTIKNLRFILDNEARFADCEKRFLLNRIVDEEKFFTLVTMITDAGYKYDVDPFLKIVYKSLMHTSARIAYLTNVNPARNKCIELGLEIADYVLPLDGGNCFRQDGWDQFDATVRLNYGDPYFVLGQSRPKTYKEFLEEPQILKEEYRFGDRIRTGMREMTIAFGKDHDQRFNEELIYGKVDKAELLWRLGIHGVWSHWEPQLQKTAVPSKFMGTVKQAGWVARLPSGDEEGDNNNRIRGRKRQEGIQLLVERVNSLVRD